MRRDRRDTIAKGHNVILLNFITTSLKAPEFATFSLLTGKWVIGNQER